MVQALVLWVVLLVSDFIPQRWKIFVSFHVRSSHTPFLFVSFLYSLSLPISATSAYQTWYSLTKKTYHFILIPTITPLFDPLEIYHIEVISWNHGRPSQRYEVLAPTVLLLVQIVPGPLKFRFGIEAVLILQICPPLDDLPYVSHHPSENWTLQ